MVRFGWLSEAEHTTRFHANQVFAHGYWCRCLCNRDSALLVGLSPNRAAQISARPDDLCAYSSQSRALQLLIDTARRPRPILRVGREIIGYGGYAADAPRGFFR